MIKKWIIPILFILLLPVVAIGDYAGETIIINCANGGFNHTNNVDSLPPTAMIHPSRNLNFDEGGRRKRGGTSHINNLPMPDVSVVIGTDGNDYSCLIDHTAFSSTKPITGSDYAAHWQLSGTTGEGAVWTTTTSYTTSKITGLYDYTLINGTQHIIVSTSKGNVYKDATTTIKTGMSTSGNAFMFEWFEDELFIADGETTPQTWNGSDAETSDINSPAADWTGTNQPFQFLKHGYGNSERLWAVGVASKPNSVYVSENGVANDFSNADGLVINIETHDSFGIVGLAEFGGRLFCFGRNNTYYIDDTSSDSSAWGPIKAQWSGGAAHRRVIVSTPNDIACMTQDGEVYAISAVQAYGDYKTVSLTRPAFINRWIKDNVLLTSINNFHGIYDPKLRAIKFFVQRKGQTEIDTALVYFVDRPAEQAWIIHGNWTNDSGYSAFCSALIREADGDYRVYTGGYGGWTWKTEEAIRSDNSNGYWGGFRFVVNADNLRIEKKYDIGFVLATEEGVRNLTIDYWVDGTAKTQRTVSLSGSGFVLGVSKLGTGTLGFKRPLSKVYQLKAVGKRLEVEIYNETAGQDFFINQLFIDFKMLGAKPS